MDRQAFYDNADEDTKEWLASQLFDRELQTIRRDKPLLDPGDFWVNELELYDRTSQNQGRLRGGAIPVSPLFSRRQKRIPAFPVRSYSARILAKSARIEPNNDLTLGDEDDDGSPKSQLPGPTTPMRLDIPEIRKRMGYTKPFEEQFRFEAEAAKADFLTTGYEHSDQETMFQGQDWLPYLQHPSRNKLQILFKGFPMAEKVVFVKHPNYWTDIEKHGKVVSSGQCYWLALALLLYGNADFWIRVKAEHLNFLEKVLMNPKHPRHTYYSRLNQAEISTEATGEEDSWQGMLNLWEMLHIPGCWMSDDICDLTADVYGVFLVLYKYGSKEPESTKWKDKVYDLKTYGAYNNRHLFLCFADGNHYQPMVPNEYYVYEFKLPRITQRSTHKYRLLTGPRRRPRDGPEHHWRTQRELIPSPHSLPSFEPEHLTRVVGYGPHDIPSPRQGVTKAASAKSPTSATERRVSVSQADVQAAQVQRAKQTALEGLEIARQYIQNIDMGRRPLPSSRPTSATTTALPTDHKGKGKDKRPADEAAEGESQAKRSRIPPPPHGRPPGDDGAPGPSRSFTPINPRRSRSQSVEIIGESRPSGSAGQQQQQQQQQQQPQPADCEDEDDGTFFKALTRHMTKSEKVDRLRQWCLDLELDTGDTMKKWKKDECVEALLATEARVRVRKHGRGQVVVSKEEEETQWPGNVVRYPSLPEEQEGQAEEEEHEGHDKKERKKGKEKAVEKNEKEEEQKKQAREEKTLVIEIEDDDG